MGPDEARDLLAWAGSRPGVLKLLKALKEAFYDETGTEYLRRIVQGTGISGERKNPELVPAPMVDLPGLGPSKIFPVPLPPALNVIPDGADRVDAGESLSQVLLSPDQDLERYEDLRIRKYDAFRWYWVCSSCGEGREYKTIGGLVKDVTCAECGKITSSPSPARLVRRRT